MIFTQAERLLKLSKTDTTEPHVGPGRYNIPREFGNPVRKKKTIKVTKSITNLLRDLDPDYDEEKYTNIMNTVMNRSKKSILLGQPSYRFPPELNLSPGVEKYNLTTGEQSKKEGRHNLQQVAFGTTYPKTQSLSVETQPHPGPDRYRVHSSWTEENKNIGKSGTVGFASHVSRKLFVPSGYPGVGHYNIIPGLEMITKRKDFHSISYDGKQGVGFNSSSPRKYQEIPKIKSTILEPVRYNLNSEEKTPSVSHKKERRFVNKSDNVPGPGAYDLSPFYAHTILKRSFNVKAAQSTNKRLNKLMAVPTLNVVEPINTKWIDVLNPNDYNITETSEGIMFNQEQRFLQRFKNSSTGPLVGPGSYNIRRDLGMPKPVFAEKLDSERNDKFLTLLQELDIEHDTKSVKRKNYIFVKKSPKLLIPFNNTSERFPREPSPDKIVPGVGTYNLRRDCTRVRKTKQVAFFTTYPKSSNLCPQPLIYPGPATYNKKPVWKKESKKWGNIATPPFANRQPRSLFVPSKNPGVGHYNIGPSLDLITTKKDFHNPWYDGRNGVFFNSSSPRECNKIPIADRTTYIYRGPGRYNIKSESKMVNLSFGTATRFCKSKDTMPGPASYQLSPFYAHTILKKTFNLPAAISAKARVKMLTHTPSSKMSTDSEWNDINSQNTSLLAANINFDISSKH